MNQYNYYPGYIPQMQQINNQNQNIINDYPYISYQFPLYGFQQFVTPYYMEVPKSLEENLQDIYQRGIVNNIIGAFFIKEHQEKMKNNKKTKVPISLVELTDEDANKNYNTNNNVNNSNNNYFNENILGQNRNNLNPGDNNNMNDITNTKEDNKEVKEENDNSGDKDKDKNSANENKNGKEDNDIIRNNNNYSNELKKPDMVF